MTRNLARDDNRLDRRRRIVSDCRTAGTPDLLLLADMIGRQEGGEDISIDDFLGWGWAARLWARDEKIRQAHQKYFPSDPPMRAAKKFVRMARDLQRASDRTLEQIGLDDPRHLIAEALQTGLTFPKERQLFNILGMQMNRCKLHRSNCIVA